MTCFYCGRPLKELTSTDESRTGINGLAHKLICKYPRCKIHPETDWEGTVELCEADMELMKKSFI